MVQPFHKAYAAEAAAADTTKPTADAVAEQVPKETTAPPSEAVTEPVPTATTEPALDIPETITATAEASETPVDTNSVTAGPDRASNSEPATTNSVSDPVTDADTPSNQDSATTTDGVDGVTTETPRTATTTKPVTTTSTSTPTTTPTADAGADSATSTDGGASTGSTGGTGDTISSAGDTSSATDDSTTTDSTTPDTGSETPADSGNDAGTGDVAEQPTSSDTDTDSPQSEVVTPDSATTSQDAEPTELNYAVTEQNFYQFSKQSCVAVGDGTFHCSQRSDREVDVNTAVYADVGESGNMEIFMRTAKGKVEQLTDNNRDDTAPHLDAESMRVVWQRMVDSRHQVIMYDLTTKEETQLTFSRNNNMEPKVSADGIVWQAWDGNDWEIMYFDGIYTDQITDNDAQDVTPAIQEGYIVWSVLGQDEQLARVYSLESEETMSITGHDGGTVANPRFVLVYDTQFDNGDVVTQGFDPETGIAQPISAQPGQKPIDIPSTDTTGEKLALIQNKGSSKNDKDVVTVVSGNTATSTGSSALTSAAELSLTDATSTLATSSAVSDVAVDLDEATIATATTTKEFPLTEYDLVIIDEGDEIVSTSTPREVPTIDRAIIEAHRASSTQQEGG